MVAFIFHAKTIVNILIASLFFMMIRETQYNIPIVSAVYTYIQSAGIIIVAKHTLLLLQRSESSNSWVE